MKKFLNGIALLLCVMSFCVIAGCSYAGSEDTPDSGAPDSNQPPQPGQVAVPVFNPESGDIDYGDTVEITCATEGASIHYTTDGTDPSAESSTYTSPIAITSNTTIKAIAIKTGMTSSEVASSIYTVKSYTVTFDANGHGTAPEPITDKLKDETITLPELTEPGYTFDGWTDGENNFVALTEYKVTSDVTFTAKWIGWNDVTSPTFSVTDSAVDYGDTVSLSCGTDGADIYYTLDGITPTAGSTKYTAPIAITADTTIKAIAVKAGMNDSAVAEKAYVIKTYTVTFDANGHGTAPDAITGKHKGEEITLPGALTESGWAFVNWNDGTTDYAAGAAYTVTGDVTIKAVWKEIPNVTNLTATCTASQTVKLTWTNPTDTDFAKVVITYGTDGKVEVLKTATPNNEAAITGLTNGTEYTFTIKTYDNADNASSGVSVKKSSFLGTSYSASTRGGLVGYTNQIQGAVVKETWMDTDGNIKIGGTVIDKTSEIVAVPTGTLAEITIPDDTSWSGYIEESMNGFLRGVFLKDRKVKLDPFIMSQYQVTQKLYMQVMGLTDEQNPSYFKSNAALGEIQGNRPVEQVSWYQACAFCNELTKKTMTEEECVYYSNPECSIVYTKGDADNNNAVYIAYNLSGHKWAKKGYRLPTDAEWEFSARGGNPNEKEWKYAYAGVQTDKQSIYAEGDEISVDNYVWHIKNSENKTHSVGMKNKNTLNLYDMSGNVFEWCYDRYDDNKFQDYDNLYMESGYVVNPLGIPVPDGQYPSQHGGSWKSGACLCIVSSRADVDMVIPSRGYNTLGFRVCRSTN